VWAVQGGADYIIGETHSSFGEAEIALKAIKEHGQGKNTCKIGRKCIEIGVFNC
jgi:hypothetical protein